ncbi:hypothetical protein [Demequina sp.]|uniref:hypothetical protein n=1 Tax=Demequina sp. TaxID=2050685 RepID=UPI003A83C761
MVTRYVREYVAEDDVLDITIAVDLDPGESTADIPLFAAMNAMDDVDAGEGPQHGVIIDPLGLARSLESPLSEADIHILRTVVDGCGAKNLHWVLAVDATGTPGADQDAWEALPEEFRATFEVVTSVIGEDFVAEAVVEGLEAILPNERRDIPEEYVGATMPTTCDRCGSRRLVPYTVAEWLERQPDGDPHNAAGLVEYVGESEDGTLVGVMECVRCDTPTPVLIEDDTSED